MIKILVGQLDNYINQVEIKGHANYNEHGLDIVCAAVSSAILTSVNLIISSNKDIINYQEKEGYVLISVLKQDDFCDRVLTNLVSVLKELEKQYPKNIKIKE